MKRVFHRDHEVHVASDARSALSQMRKHCPDAIVVDILLADDNGLDLIEDMRREQPDARVVAMSCHPGREIVAAAIASGADAFVAKEELALVGKVLDLFEHAAL